jgi:hypothetical protein
MYFSKEDGGTSTLQAQKNKQRRTKVERKKKGFEWVGRLCPESVECSSLPFQRVDDIQRSDCFPLGMFSVSHRVSDHVLQEDLYEDGE